jgi:O-antigen/teichoic acid export membrane protein
MLSNTFFSFFSNIIYKVVNVAVFIIINNIYGKESAGIFSLSLTYLLIFSSFSIGFDELLTKEFLSAKYKLKTLVKKFVFSKTLFSLISFLLIYILTNLYFDYDYEIKKMIYWMGACLLFESYLMLSQAFLYAMNHFKTPAISFSFIGIIRISGSVYILINHLSLEYIGMIWLLGSILGAIVILLQLYKKLRKLPANLNNDKLTVKMILTKSQPYISLSFLTSIEYQIDVLIISYFKTTYEIGIYSSITTIFSLLGLVGQAFRSTIYPLMVKAKQISNYALNQVYLTSYKLLWIVVIPICVGLFVLAPEFIHFIFGDGFELAIIPLRVMTWALIPVFLNISNTRFLLSSDQQQLLPKFVFISMIVNFICNIILIPNIGIIGASLARNASSITYYLLSVATVKQFIPSSIDKSSVIKSVGISILMGIIVNTLRNIFQINIFLLIIVGILVYVALVVFVGLIKRDDIKFILLASEIGDH